MILNSVESTIDVSINGGMIFVERLPISSDTESIRLVGFIFVEYQTKSSMSFSYSQITFDWLLSCEWQEVSSFSNVKQKTLFQYNWLYSKQ